MENGLLAEYEDIILGKKKLFTSSYFDYSDTINTNTALNIFRYAIEYFLEWSPQEAYDKLNMDIIKLMHLEYAFSKITFPNELEKKKDLWYIACRLYPKYFNFKESDLTINIFKKIISGEIKRFPTNYFSGTLGIYRACECLQYVLVYEMSMLFYKEQDIYYYFSTEIGIQFLKKYKLFNIYQEYFDNPIEYVHNSISSVQQDELFLHFYKFKWDFAKHLRRLKRENEVIDIESIPDAENLTDNHLDDNENITKEETEISISENVNENSIIVKRKRGRPKGSKNKK